MRNGKHEAKKQEILESAFRIWGKDRFQTRSLSQLASAHNMTKQALYRYFPSKGKLEAAMEERATGIYQRHTSGLMESLEKTPSEIFTEVYMDRSIEFIRKQQPYINFLSHRFRSSEDPDIYIEGTKQSCELAMRIADIPESGVRYLHALMLIESNCGKETCSHRWKKPWNEGLLSAKVSREPDFNRLLNDASRIDLKIFAEDPLMLAVFEAVMEEAGDTVSLGKVARKAGLTKSSLYNYWPSKEAMLQDVLDRQMDIYTSLFEKFVEKYSDPADRLFAYLAFTGTFFRRTPEILNYMQRVISFGVSMKSGHESESRNSRFTRVLNDVIDDGYLNLQDYRPEEILGLTNLAAVLEVKNHLAEKSTRIRFEQGLKDLYRLIMGGIPALRRTM